MTRCPFCEKVPAEEVRDSSEGPLIGCFDGECSVGPKVMVTGTIAAAVEKWDGLDFDYRRI